MKSVVLFVCQANRARSPIAEALFNHKIVDLGYADICQAQSAGTWGEDDLPAASESIELMAQRGLDINTHRSRIITTEIIDSAKLILTVEAGQKEALEIEFPGYQDKIMLFSELVGQSYDINDPYGKTVQDFEEAVTEIEHILDQGMSMIIQKI